MFLVFSKPNNGRFAFDIRLETLSSGNSVTNNSSDPPDFPQHHFSGLTVPYCIWGKPGAYTSLWIPIPLKHFVDLSSETHSKIYTDKPYTSERPFSTYKLFTNEVFRAHRLLPLKWALAGDKLDAAPLFKELQTNFDKDLDHVVPNSWLEDIC